MEFSAPVLNYTLLSPILILLGGALIGVLVEAFMSKALRPVTQLSVSLSGTYTGSRFDGNDTENDRYQRLDDALVFDSKLTYAYKNLIIFSGINNIFNELYSTNAYSEQYYPMPERKIYGGIRWMYF